MTINEAQNIYFIGIGGIGVSAVARLCLAHGKQVSGSDMRDSSTVQELQNLGIEIRIGHDVMNVSNLPDLAVYSEDISPDSAGYVELKHLKDQNVPVLTYAQALGQMMDEKYGIGVTGTNGKSTTTAILALILTEAGLDPTVVLGSKISPANSGNKFEANARLGTGEFFVAEADEYHRHMLEAHPKMIVVTNIAEDHLDYYKDLHDIKQAFTEYVMSLPKDGIVVFNADDHNTVDVCRRAECHKFTFGIEHYADLQAMNIKTENGVQEFDLHLNDQNIGHFTLRLPGRFNVSNAVGAILAALKLGVGIESIKKTVAGFNGIWRRFEKVGDKNGKIVISDYAHHPAGVSGTIQAAKEFYPGKKIMFVFQPHHRNRTKKLFGEFAESLVGAENLILPEIFDVAGREHGEKISSQDLVQELAQKGFKAEYAADLDAAEKLIKEKMHDFDVLVCMGAGDIDLMARRLVEYL